MYHNSENVWSLYVQDITVMTATDTLRDSGSLVQYFTIAGIPYSALTEVSSSFSYEHKQLICMAGLLCSNKISFVVLID